MSSGRLTLPDAVSLRALAGVQRDWQCHHLLPRGLSRHRQISLWLAEIGNSGPLFKERNANILWLPASEAVAATTGMALHRGPHPAYNDVVAARLERIRTSAIGAQDARAKIACLQRALTTSLSGQAHTAIRLNRHDPMRLFADYGSLDDAIAQLFNDQPS